ncbi:MAG TPA: MarR family winged helix-turn-helix transcriptional regulator [Streptosporangiaceae bacterium]|nr:MarR family winged helix-turn-helix transcriptional regulator [Streptosporangiaceae bacterium]
MAENAGGLSPEDWEFWDRWMSAQRRLVLEIDRRLQRRFGISKAEFSVLVTLRGAAGGEMRVVELADTLGWDKSRVAHQLTRMEARGLVDRVESGARGRRTGIRLAKEGRRLAEEAVAEHAAAVREIFFDAVTPAQLEAIGSWSTQMINRAARTGREETGREEEA